MSCSVQKFSILTKLFLYIFSKFDMQICMEVLFDPFV